MVAWCARESVPNARRIEDANHRARTRPDPVLGEEGRGVLEKARVDKRRSDPDRMQGRNKTELEDGNSDGHERGGLLIAARSRQGDGAFMARRIGITVNQLVPSRHRAEQEHRDEAGRDRTRNNIAKDRKRAPQIILHRRLPSLARPHNASGFVAHNRLSISFHPDHRNVRM